jgi:mannose-P-dolichol utilization defect protein 1
MSVKTHLKWILPALTVIGVTTLLLLTFYVQKHQQVPLPFSLVLTNECGVAFLVNYDVFNRKCLQLTISKLLSYSIVLLSTMLKLPIILNILRAKSTIGLSSISVILENFALCSSFASSMRKGFAFSLWGEVLIVYVQNLIILTLARYYSPKGKEDPSLVWLLTLAVYTAAVCLVDEISPDLLIIIATLISMTSRIPQLLTNFSQKHTGVLSLVTQTLQCVGVSVRLFTVVVETGDKAQIGSYLIALILNALLFAQVVIYWENTKTEMAKTNDRKKQ